jgi:hypothetical protein
MLLTWLTLRNLASFVIQAWEDAYYLPSMTVAQWTTVHYDSGPSKLMSS